MSAGAPTGGANPFVSVLLPTDGARPQALRESLLGLFGQADADFEVVLVAAALGEDARTALTQTVADQPPSMARRLHVVHTQATTPGAIRNAGLEVAVGRLVTVLVPGDVPLGSWVQAFRTGAEHGGGAVVRAQGLTQRHAYDNLLGEDAVRAEGSPRAESPEAFSLWQHAVEAVSLAGSWAWPRTSTDQGDVRFDETITDDADHELLVRLVERAGVHSLADVTIIHHEWSDQSSELPLDGPRAKDVLDQRPLLLPPGEARAIATSLPQPESTTDLQTELTRAQTELRLTHDHARNLQAQVDALQQQLEAAEDKHAKRVARLKEKVAALQAGATPTATDAPAERRPGLLRMPRAKGRSGPD